MTLRNIKLNALVYHKGIYWGKEQMKIVGIRETEVELEGDWSGGTHNVCQKGWMPIRGLLKNMNTTPYSKIISSFKTHLTNS